MYIQRPDNSCDNQKKIIIESDLKTSIGPTWFEGTENPVVNTRYLHNSLALVIICKKRMCRQLHIILIQNFTNYSCQISFDNRFGNQGPDTQFGHDIV